MTMQICLVAKDGFVVASDTLKVALRGNDFNTHESKIAISTDGQRICCWAGDEISKEIALKLLAKSPVQEVNKWLEEECNVAWKSIAEVRKQGGARRGILFGLATQCDRPLWVMFPGEKSHVRAVLGNYEVNGDIYSEAVYFLRRFYKNNDPKRAALELLPLAAQVIFAAGQLNPKYIDGMELAVAKEGKWQRLGARETEGLLGKVQKWDTDFHAVFLPTHRSGEV